MPNLLRKIIGSSYFVAAAVEKQFYEFFYINAMIIIKLIIVGLEMSLCPCWMREAQGYQLAA